MRSYWDALRHRRFALLWSGLTVSSLGDSMSRLSLIWLIYHVHGSAADLGLLVTTYSAPIIAGGPLSGWLLDRVGVRRAMLADNVIRGTVTGLVPILYHLNALQLWHLYAVAAIYGLMRMITLAGTPSLLPHVLPADHLNAANALETVSFSVSSVAGLPLSGFLLGVLNGADILALDATSYFVLAGCLLAIGPVGQRPRSGVPARHQGLQPAFRLMNGNPFLRNSTLMYMFLNVGHGILDVLIPVLVIRMGDSGQKLGIVTGAAALGQLGGSVLSGAFAWPLPFTRLIAWALALGGLPLIGIAVSTHWIVLAAALTASAILQAPLTVWAQTVRMRIIPEDLRGRVFALLRTIMQAGPAIGGVVGGWIVSTAPSAMVVAISVGLMSGPGILSLTVPSLLDDAAARPSPHQPQC